MAPEDIHLTLRIILENPPYGVAFGIQKGRGRDYETILKQESDGDDLCFQFTISLKDVNTVPKLRGPLVHGPTDKQFVYIDIGTFAGQAESPWNRRLKIPLTGIGGSLIERAAGKVLETYVPGTGKDGGPSCGTAKPFNGWSIAPAPATSA